MSCTYGATSLFLSTPSARRATQTAQFRIEVKDISIHALREEGDPVRCRGPRRGPISIHALREEGDLTQPINFAGLHLISIHALREEGD